MDFVRSKFGTNEPLPVEHFFPGLSHTHPANRSKSEKKSGRGSFVLKLLLTKSIL